MELRGLGRVTTQKARGDIAEREAAAMLTQLTGTPIRRLLGAGRKDDIGDLDTAHLGCAIQVRNVTTPTQLPGILVRKVRDAETQAARSGLAAGFALARISRPKGCMWRVSVCWDHEPPATLEEHQGNHELVQWERAVYGPCGNRWSLVESGKTSVVVTTPGAWWAWWQTKITG